VIEKVGVVEERKIMSEKLGRRDSLKRSNVEG